MSFAAGDLTKTISVTINGDTTVEPDETFFVNLLGATSGGTIVKSQGIGTITNDDAVGNISISDVTIAEGNAGTSTATFTVTRDRRNRSLRLNYATADGTATAGSDYVAQPTGTVSFAAGDLTKTISVTINGDTTVEPDETFFVNLLGATNGGTIVKSQGTRHHHQRRRRGGRRQHLDQRRHHHRGQLWNQGRHLHGQPHRQRSLFRELRHREQHGDGRHQRRLPGDLGHAQLR